MTSDSQRLVNLTVHRFDEATVTHYAKNGKDFLSASGNEDMRKIFAARGAIHRLEEFAVPVERGAPAAGASSPRGGHVRQKERRRRRVFSVGGNPYHHTDTIMAGYALPHKFARTDPAVARRRYLETLVSHYIIGLSRFVVMAQSGFGDTGFWRSRGAARCLFVDMNHLRLGWQHRLSYHPIETSSSPSALTSTLPCRWVDDESKPPPGRLRPADIGAVDDPPRDEKGSCERLDIDAEGVCGCPAVATHNAVITF